MLHLAAPSLTQQFEYASARAIPILVTLLASSFSASGTVKVQNLICSLLANTAGELAV